MLTEINIKILELSKKIKTTKTININSKNIKDCSIELSRKYFTTIRPKMELILSDTNIFTVLDAEFQKLVSLAHGNNPRNSYMNVIKNIQIQIRQISILEITQYTTSSISITTNENKIYDTIFSILPSAALSYKQGIIDLQNNEDKISYRGTATEFRESLREVLDHLAPDNEVTSDPNFKLEKDRTKPTMKQKVKYILKSRGKNKTEISTSADSISIIEELIGSLTRSIYDRASLSTHTITSKEEVQRIKRYMDIVFLELLEL